MRPLCVLLLLCLCTRASAVASLRGGDLAPTTSAVTTTEDAKKGKAKDGNPAVVAVPITSNSTATTSATTTNRTENTKLEIGAVYVITTNTTNTTNSTADDAADSTGGDADDDEGDDEVDEEGDDKGGDEAEVKGEHKDDDKTNDGTSPDAGNVEKVPQPSLRPSTVSPSTANSPAPGVRIPVSPHVSKASPTCVPTKRPITTKPSKSEPVSASPSQAEKPEKGKGKGKGGTTPPTVRPTTKKTAAPSGIVWVIIDEPTKKEGEEPSAAPSVRAPISSRGGSAGGKVSPTFLPTKRPTKAEIVDDDNSGNPMEPVHEPGSRSPTPSTPDEEGDGSSTSDAAATPPTARATEIPSFAPVSVPEPEPVPAPEPTAGADDTIPPPTFSPSVQRAALPEDGGGTTETDTGPVPPLYGGDEGGDDGPDTLHTVVPFLIALLLLFVAYQICCNRGGTAEVATPGPAQSLPYSRLPLSDDMVGIEMERAVSSRSIGVEAKKSVKAEGGGGGGGWDEGGWDDTELEFESDHDEDKAKTAPIPAPIPAPAPAPAPVPVPTPVFAPFATMSLPSLSVEHASSFTSSSRSVIPKSPGIGGLGGAKTAAQRSPVIPALPRPKSSKAIQQKSMQDVDLFATIGMTAKPQFNKKPSSVTAVSTESSGTGWEDDIEKDLDDLINFDD